MFLCFVLRILLLYIFSVVLVVIDLRRLTVGCYFSLFHFAIVGLSSDLRHLLYCFVGKFVTDNPVCCDCYPLSPSPCRCPPLLILCLPLLYWSPCLAHSFFPLLQLQRVGTVHLVDTAVGDC